MPGDEGISTLHLQLRDDVVGAVNGGLGLPLFFATELQTGSGNLNILNRGDVQLAEKISKKLF